MVNNFRIKIIEWTKTLSAGEMFPTMKNVSDRKERKLNYIIHNPNSVEETTKFLLEVLVQANTDKVERALQTLMHDEKHNENKAYY